jgi:hypothetical protein
MNTDQPHTAETEADLKTKVYKIEEFAALAAEFLRRNLTTVLRGERCAVCISEAAEAVVTNEYPFDDDHDWTDLWVRRHSALGYRPDTKSLTVWGQYVFPVLLADSHLGYANFVRAHMAAAIEWWLDNDPQYEDIRELSADRFINSGALFAQEDVDAAQASAAAIQSDNEAEPPN